MYGIPNKFGSPIPYFGLKNDTVFYPQARASYGKLPSIPHEIF